MTCIAHVSFDKKSRHKDIKHISTQMCTFFGTMLLKIYLPINEVKSWLATIADWYFRMQIIGFLIHFVIFFSQSNLVFLHCETLSVSQGKTLFYNYNLVVTTYIQDTFLTNHVIRARPTMFYPYSTWQQGLWQYNIQV